MVSRMNKQKKFLTNGPQKEEKKRKFPHKLSANKELGKGVIYFYVQIILDMTNIDFV